MSLRHFVIMPALVGVITLADLSAPARGAEAPVTEQAVVRFQDPVLVGGRFLMGRVLIVHDEELKARGEPCTLIYRLDGEKPPEQASSTHSWNGFSRASMPNAAEGGGPA